MPSLLDLSNELLYAIASNTPDPYSAFNMSLCSRRLHGIFIDRAFSILFGNEEYHRETMLYALSYCIQASRLDTLKNMLEHAQHRGFLNPGKALPGAAGFDVQVSQELSCRPENLLEFLALHFAYADVPKDALSVLSEFGATKRLFKSISKASKRGWNRGYLRPHTWKSPAGAYTFYNIQVSREVMRLIDGDSWEEIRQLLALRGVFVDTDLYLLHYACIYGSPDSVRVLISVGADVNRQASQNLGYMKPLHAVLCLKSKEKDISEDENTDEKLRKARFLLASGADVNGIDDWTGDTVLQGILRQKSRLPRDCFDKILPVVYFLLENGADPNAGDFKNCPIILALRSSWSHAGLKRVMQQLVTNGADVTRVGPRGESFLDVAVMLGRVSAFSPLIEAGAQFKVGKTLNIATRTLFIGSMDKLLTACKAIAAMIKKKPEDEGEGSLRRF